MHDIDRTSIQPYAQVPQGEYEYDQEYEFDLSPTPFGMGGSNGSPFTEAQEMELAAELLGVSNEAEMEQFLEGLFKKAASFGNKAFRTAKRFADSKMGRTLGGIFKGVAAKALPVLGKAAGAALTTYTGPAGPMIGDAGASLVGSALGLELEGLSPEDQEFEVAKQLVRLVGNATQRAADMASHIDPVAAAKSAMVAAAKEFAPDLLRPVNGRQAVRDHRSPRTTGIANSGTWVRQGNGIVLMGL